jgi:Na+/H+-dicarboxylate symporter
MLEIKPLNYLSVHLDQLIKGRLWLKVTIGLILGAGLGVLINPSSGLVSEELSLSLANWLDLPRQVFMRLVQMIIIPLIFASIISGIVSNTSGNLKAFGVKLLLYFDFTIVLSIAIGLAVTLIMKPG